MSFYKSAIALYCTVCELFDVEYYRDREMWVRGHSRSLKLVPFESLGAVFCSSSMVTMALFVAVCEIFSVKEWCDLENRVRVRSRSLDHYCQMCQQLRLFCCRVIDRIGLPIHLP